MESNDTNESVETIKAELAKEEAVAETVQQVEAKADAKPAEPTTEEKIQAILAKRKEAPLSLKDSTELRKLKKQLKAIQVQRGYFQKMIGQWRRNDDKAKKRLLSQVRAASKTLGAQNFSMLKDLYTQVVPEQKDDKGEVIQPATTTVNYQGLLVEARHAIVIEREARIKAGKRKKTTGRSSSRRDHRNTFNFLTRRNAEEAIKQVQAVKE